MSDAEPKKKRTKRIAEPPLGFGRDIELTLRDPRDHQLRVALFVAGLGALFLGFGAASRDHDPRLFLVAVCGGALLAIAVYLALLWFRHRGRADWQLRLTHREIDVPRIALFGPLRVTCALNELGPVALMTQQGGFWIEAQPFHGPTLKIIGTWLPSEVPVREIYWRLAVRQQIARSSGGKAKRAAVVGSEAMIGLSSPSTPVGGVVLSRAQSKHPIVIATVASPQEYFARFAEWPEDSKLVVPNDVREQFVAALSDPSRLL